MADDYANYLADPNDPYGVYVGAGSFGGPNDKEDNGKFAHGGGSILPNGQINPEFYAAFRHQLFEDGLVRPGGIYHVTNPSNGITIPVVARDEGPSAAGRGADFAPHALKALGANTDDPLHINFIERGYVPQVGAGPQQALHEFMPPQLLNGNNPPPMTPADVQNGVTDAGQMPPTMTVTPKGPPPDNLASAAVQQPDPFSAQLSSDLSNASLSAGPTDPQAAADIYAKQQAIPDADTTQDSPDGGGGGMTPDEVQDAVEDAQTAQSTQAPAGDEGITAPSSANARPVFTNPKAGFTQYSNGVKKFADGHIEWQEGSRTYSQQPNALPHDVSPLYRTSTIQGDDGYYHTVQLDSKGKAPPIDHGIAISDPSMAAAKPLRAQLMQMGYDVGGKTPDQITDMYNQIQMTKGFIPTQMMERALKIVPAIAIFSQLKNWAQVRQAKEEVDTGYEQSKTQPGGPADIALAEGTLRMLNPGIGVRYGMLTNLQDAVGVLRQNMPNFLWEKAWDGSKFTQWGRDQLMDIANKQYNSQVQNIRPDIKAVTNLVGSLGVKNPELLAANLVEQAPLMDPQGQVVPGQATIAQPAAGATPAPTPQASATPIPANSAYSAAQRVLATSTDPAKRAQAQAVLNHLSLNGITR